MRSIRRSRIPVICVMFYIKAQLPDEGKARNGENELVTSIDFVRTSLDASLDIVFHLIAFKRRMCYIFEAAKKCFNLNICVAVKSDFNIT